MKIKVEVGRLPELDDYSHNVYADEKTLEFVVNALKTLSGFESFENFEAKDWVDISTEEFNFLYQNKDMLKIEFEMIAGKHAEVFAGLLLGNFL